MAKDYVLLTDKGVVRSENQDTGAFFEIEGARLAIVCDGMGGHAGGQTASSMTVSYFVDAFRKEYQANFTYNESTRWFNKNLDALRKEMIALSKKQPDLADMGTTITMAVITDKTIRIWNIGDSRTYAYNGLLNQITKDHNLWNYYVDHLGYTVEQAATVPQAMALISSFGPNKTTKKKGNMVVDKDGIEYLVLTTDGVHDFVDKPKFETIIGNKKMPLIDKAHLLVETAIKNRSSDNLTILIVEVN